jgi:hypothetical protein
MVLETEEWHLGKDQMWWKLDYSLDIWFMNGTDLQVNLK